MKAAGAFAPLNQNSTAATRNTIAVDFADAGAPAAPCPLGAGSAGLDAAGFAAGLADAAESLGAGLPGMSAVVMITSTSFACFANTAACAFWKPSLISLA